MGVVGRDKLTSRRLDRDSETLPNMPISNNALPRIISRATAHFALFALLTFLMFRVSVAVTTKFSQRKPLLGARLLRLAGLIVARAAILANERDLNPLIQ